MQTEESYYPFQLGRFRCACLLDGYTSYPVQQVDPHIFQSLTESDFREGDQSVATDPFPVTLLFVDSGSGKILVDLGGDQWIPGTGRLAKSLKDIGVQPDGITNIIISHAHPDHIGGMLDYEGKPVYPNAACTIARDEWNFWFSSASRGQVSDESIIIARLNLEPVRDRVILTIGETEVLPGVRVIPTPGHTPGHLAVSVQSGRQKLLYTGESVFQPNYLKHPNWVSSSDLLPELASASKKRIFDLASDKDYLVVGAHFSPFPGLGKISKGVVGWQWNPIRS